VAVRQSSSGRMYRRTRIERCLPWNVCLISPHERDLVSTTWDTVSMHRRDGGKKIKIFIGTTETTRLWRKERKKSRK
jgi:hypothetical protein